jgi:hypothetical protein
MMGTLGYIYFITAGLFGYCEKVLVLVCKIST